MTKAELTDPSLTFMMADGRVENVKILFSDIAESIDYIWRIAKQKSKKQSILKSVAEERAI